MTTESFRVEEGGRQKRGRQRRGAVRRTQPQVAGFEDGGKGHKARNVSLLELKRQKTDSPIQVPEQTHLHFDCSPVRPISYFRPPER